MSNFSAILLPAELFLMRQSYQYTGSSRKQQYIGRYVAAWTSLLYSYYLKDGEKNTQ